MNSKRTRHSAYDINYHFVWMPKFRRKILIDRLATCLEELIRQKTTELGGEVLNATSIQQMLRRVDKVYRAFYKGQRGAPRFKGRHRFKSIEYRYGDGCKLSEINLYIQHIGNVRVKLHRSIPGDATIKYEVCSRYLWRRALAPVNDRVDSLWLLASDYS